MILFALSLAQTKYELIDGTIIVGDIVSQSDTEIVINTKFGEVTILKSDILIRTYTIVMTNGTTLNGEKISEDETTINIKSDYGTLTLEKEEILSITEGYSSSDNQSPGVAYNTSVSLSQAEPTEFSIGQEKLIDYFFDPTAYTLDEGVLYLSGLSFGFGLSDRVQVTTKWGNFFWGDMNIRPKLTLFEKGNWEKQHALSVGAHYHTRWASNKKSWHSIEVDNIVVVGDWIDNLEWDNQTLEYTYLGLCGDMEWSGCYQQTGVETKYLNGYHDPYEVPEFGYEYDDDWYVDHYSSHTDSEGNTFYQNEPHIRRIDDSYDSPFHSNYFQMVEFFTAYTTSKARSNKRGRISHTMGANVQLVLTDSDVDTYYRLYYGVDIDINSKLKMISEIFYDPYYLELWQEIEYSDWDNYISGDDLQDEIEAGPNVVPVHLDFGFIYAFNEHLRIGFHFQRPFFAIYWKF